MDSNLDLEKIAEELKGKDFFPEKTAMAEIYLDKVVMIEEVYTAPIIDDPGSAYFNAAIGVDLKVVEDFPNGMCIRPRKWSRNHCNRVKLFIRQHGQKKKKDNYWKKLLKKERKIF